MSDASDYSSEGSGGEWSNPLGAPKKKTGLEDFFERTNGAKELLDKRIGVYCRKVGPLKTTEQPAKYKEALRKLKELVEGLTWDELKKHPDEDELLTYVNGIMDQANAICETILGMLSGGELSQDHLREFFECLAPWICKDTFMGASFWNRDGTNQKVLSQLLGGSHLMRRITEFHATLAKVKADGGGILDLEKQGFSCIDVASLAGTPSALSVAGRADWAAKIVVDMLAREGQAPTPLSLLDVGAGDGPLAEAIVKEALKRGVAVENVALMDMDRTALQRAQTREALSAIIPEILPTDLREKGALKGKGKRANMSMGYGDYIERDEDFVDLLKDLIASSPDDSIVGFGVFKTGHPHSHMLTLGLHWRLKTRTPKELAEIGRRAGLIDVKVHEMPINGSTEKTCQLFLTGRKPLGWEAPTA